MSMNSDDHEQPIWMTLANHLAGFVKIERRHTLQVYAGKCFGEPAAILRVWLFDKELESLEDNETDEARIKSTISLSPDEAVCSDNDRGIRSIDLKNPGSCQQIVTWMVLVGIAPAGTSWHD